MPAQRSPKAQQDEVAPSWGDAAQAMFRAAQAVSHPGGPGLFEDLVRALAEILGAAAVFVAVFKDEQRTEMRTLAAVLDGRTLRNFDYPLAGSPCAKVVGRAYRHVASGVAREFAPHTIFAAKGMDSYAAFPIEDASGAPLGLLAAMDRRPIADAALAEALLKIFAGRIVAEIERGRADEALRTAALAVSSARGESVFAELVRYLAAILRVEVAFIARVEPDDPQAMRMLAMHYDGEVLQGQRYALAGTPCATVLGQEFRAYPSGLQELFPADHDAKLQGTVSYAGYPMRGLDGRALGNISIASRRPLVHLERIESMLKIFAMRAAAEIEQLAGREALERSAASYRAIFDSAEDAIFVHDWDTGAIVDVNPKACQTYGYTCEEMKRLSVADVSSGVPPYTAAQAMYYIGLAKIGRCPPFEWQRRNKDGTLHWDEVRLKVAQIDGRPHILAFTRDITEHKQALEALRAREEQYRAVFDASADALTLWDSDCRRVDVNPAYETLYGWSRDEVIGRGFDFPPFSADHVRFRGDLVRRALAGETVRAEHDVVAKNGGRRQAEVLAIPFRQHGRAHALVIARDITERKRAEEALRTREEQYRAIFDSSADSMGLWDEQLRLVDVNRAFTRISGWTREEVLGKTLQQRAGEPELERRAALMRAALAGEEGRIEVQVPKKDGSRMHVETRYVPVQFGERRYALSIARDITERKRAEEALRASEEQYRAIFAASADALILWDSQYRRVDVNPAYERLFGWTREEVIGRSWDRPDDGEEYGTPRRDLVRRALAGETCRRELASRCKDGSIIQIEVHATPFRHRGEPHVLAIARDITERRRAEERLRAREEQYRAIFDGSVDPMVLWNRSLQVVDVNAAFEQTTGMSRSEVVGRHWSERPDAAEMHRLLPSIERALAGELVHRVESVSRADGSPFDIELRYLPVRLGGEPYALGIGRDVTVRLEQERALQRSEVRLRATVEAAFDCVIGMDGEGRIVEWNAAAERCFGRRRETVLGRSLANVIIPPRFHETHAQMLRTFRPSGGSPMVGRLIETTALRADGTEIPVELAISVAAVPEGTIFVCHVRDISARRAAEAERAALEAQLRQAQKMEAIGQLTGGIAHDFNNILTSVLGYLTLGQERAQALGDAKLVRQLGQADLAAQRARDLVAQMLAFARRQRGERRALALPALVRQTLQLLRPTLPATVVLDAVVLDEPDGRALPAVLADAVQVEQVLFNLCINARDAMPGGGVIRVQVGEPAAEHEGGGLRCAACGEMPGPGRWVELVVADSGHGIPPEVLRRMFEPFFTTKEVGRGSGMGLAMVHGIVHEHGGHVVVETALGQGTTFRVLLPAAEAEAGAAHAGDALVPREAAALAGRVLVVEDEVMVGDFMAELLEDWGLEVVLMREPAAALAWVERQLGQDGAPPDLLLTDQTMPQMTGIELADRCRALRPGLPVLLYTGNPGAIDPTARARAGVQELLAKPVDPDVLRSALRRCLSAERA
ncbi:MAG: PAS domain S-box protein [Rubrivivax sp.]|nr:PAS domain S-box protein [Rubrivivax sp.]